MQNGTAGAVELARPFIDEDLLIIFVDTLFDADLAMVKRLPPDVAGVIWVKEVEDYQRFGVIVTDEHGYMQRIIEKPKEPVSKLANIGLYYIRDWKLLFKGIRNTMEGPLGPSGEYYLTDAFQYMVDRGSRLKIVEVEGWYDCGKPETLIESNRHLLETSRGRRPNGSRNARIHDPVRVEEGVTLVDSEIGPNVTIETGTTVKGAHLRDTLIGRDCAIEGATLHDSIVGDRSTVRGIRGSVSVAPDSELVGDE